MYYLLCNFDFVMIGMILHFSSKTLNSSRITNQWTHSSTVRAPVFGRHQFFGTSEHYGKAHGSLSSGGMNYNYTACCWFPTSRNILILPSQFWQIGFESYWSHCSKCRILVLLLYFPIQAIAHFSRHTALPSCVQPILIWRGRYWCYPLGSVWTIGSSACLSSCFRSEIQEKKNDLMSYVTS